MKKFISYILVSAFFCSCVNTNVNNELKVEIYLTKKRIDSNQGIEITDSIISALDLNHLRSRFNFNVVRLDTISSDFIFAGDFKAEIEDLEAEPLLGKEDIESFDPKTGQLSLNSKGVKKLGEIEVTSYGRQFVLFINDESKIYGYFFPTIYSSYCSTFHYEYVKNLSTMNLVFGKESKTVVIE